MPFYPFHPKSVQAAQVLQVEAARQTAEIESERHGFPVLKQFPKEALQIPASK